MADRSGFDEFVATRSRTLLRTAYLLTGDHGLAEDLLQTAREVLVRLGADRRASRAVRAARAGHDIRHLVAAAVARRATDR